MAFLNYLSYFPMLLAIAFLLAAFFGERITDRTYYRRGLGVYVAGMICSQVLPGILGMVPFLAVVLVALGSILLLVSLQLLCLSLCGKRAGTEAQKS
jgi:hypothetical protein